MVFSCFDAYLVEMGWFSCFDGDKRPNISPPGVCLRRRLRWAIAQIAYPTLQLHHQPRQKACRPSLPWYREYSYYVLACVLCLTLRSGRRPFRGCVKADCMKPSHASEKSSLCTSTTVVRTLQFQLAFARRCIDHVEAVSGCFSCSSHYMHFPFTGYA